MTTPDPTPLRDLSALVTAIETTAGPIRLAMSATEPGGRFAGVPPCGRLTSVRCSGVAGARAEEVAADAADRTGDQRDQHAQQDRRQPEPAPAGRDRDDGVLALVLVRLVVGMLDVVDGVELRRLPGREHRAAAEPERRGRVAPRVADGVVLPPGRLGLGGRRFDAGARRGREAVLGVGRGAERARHDPRDGRRRRCGAATIRSPGGGGERAGARAGGRTPCRSSGETVGGGGV